MQRSIEEFQKAAEVGNIRRWPIRSCSICGTPIGYMFRPEGVYWDGACECTSYGELEPCSWEEVAEHYNRNQPERNEKISPAQVAAADTFWGFVPAPA